MLQRLYALWLPINSLWIDNKYIYFPSVNSWGKMIGAYVFLDDGTAVVVSL